MTTLNELAALLDAATGPSRALNDAVHKALVREAIYSNSSIWMWRDGSGCVENATASIDAALALVERLLPDNKHGIQVHLYNQFGEAACKIGDCFNASLEAPTAPLAILKALVAALITQEAEHD